MTRFFDSIRQSGFRRGPSRLVGGICGGLADKAGISVTVVRVLVLLSFLLPVVGVGAYLVAWILTPWQNGSIPLERFIDRLGGRETL
ncbi:PspC domain-containing protein [Ruania halotolerans]|uniref:PspC domain-containing protein n=1 Tax=Ruania halotolerans TaxID=2897773 RepID=UPI001E5933D4|nr:PspC domain-containing protein [Ruania halotolerans]UFU05106.1 PspC domain-containing protein [Ruania halotolerans]